MKSRRHHRPEHRGPRPQHGPRPGGMGPGMGNQAMQDQMRGARSGGGTAHAARGRGPRSPGPAGPTRDSFGGGVGPGPHGPMYGPHAGPGPMGPWAGPHGEGPALGPGGLEELTERPDFVHHTDSTLVQTCAGIVIEMKGHEVHFYDPDGTCFTRIWGDPHVDEGCDGKDDWHFGNDSTFVLPDGTKVCLDTEPNEAGEYYVVGVDILSGRERYHYGEGGDQGKTRDAQKFDRENADYAVDDATAGVFMLAESGEWAVIGDDGHLHDVQDESWGDYLKDKDVDFDADSIVQAMGLRRSGR